MENWVYLQNTDYETPVRCFIWTDESNSLIVRFESPIEFERYNEYASVAEFTPVPRETYEKLKQEVQSEEKTVNEHYWFFKHVRKPASIKENIEQESDVNSVEMTPYKVN